MLIPQSWDTSIGDSCKLLEGEEMWDPQCFAFSTPVQETEDGKAEHNYKLHFFFLIRDDIWQVFFNFVFKRKKYNIIITHRGSGDFLGS